MGSGKTEWAIQYMDEHAGEQFIYITPFNDEISGRVIPACPALKFKFAKEGRKLEEFKECLVDGRNIAATHECLKRIDAEMLSLLECNNYTLILDEVMQLIDTVRVSKQDTDLLREHFIVTAENGYVSWREDQSEYKGRFAEIKDMADAGRLVLINDTFFFWLLPVEIFKHFKDVYILTYMFSAQIQRYYFDISGVACKLYQIENGALTPHMTGAYANDLKPLIEIYDGRMNDIGKNLKALSVGWFKSSRNNAACGALRKNIYNYFKNICAGDVDQRLWTTFKNQKEKLQDKGYTKAFLACNARSTNKYRHTTAIVYTVNLFLNPQIKNNFFKNNFDVDIDEDLWALSEMVQFIWRSAIREGKHIQVYIPSKRMRELLIKYLNNEI